MFFKHKVYFIIFFSIFIFIHFIFEAGVLAEDSFKYFLSIKKAELRLQPDDKSTAFAQIEKNVYLKSYGWKENWLLVNVEYNNLFATSLNDVDIHFNGWVYKEDFREIDINQINQNPDIYSASISNTVYIPQDEDVRNNLKERWKKAEKYFSEDKNIEIFTLPNYNYEKTKTILADKSIFTVNLECRDWQYNNWSDIFYFSEGDIKRGWIKTTIKIKPYEELLLEEAKKEMEKEKKEKAEQVKKIIIEIKLMMQEIDAKKKEAIKVTGREDIDKRIKEIEIQKLTDELQNKLNKLDSLKAD